MPDKTEIQVQTGVRLPAALLARLDKIATQMSQPGIRVTRTEVLRLAVFRGVEQLESEKKRK